MAAAPPGRRGPTTAGSIILHPILHFPLPSPPRPSTAGFMDVPMDVLRLVAGLLGEHGSARDLAAFEGVCVATR